MVALSFSELDNFLSVDTQKIRDPTQVGLGAGIEFFLKENADILFA